jgi:hypothetical protein
MPLSTPIRLIPLSTFSLYSLLLCVLCSSSFQRFAFFCLVVKFIFSIYTRNNGYRNPGNSEPVENPTSA